MKYAYRKLMPFQKRSYNAKYRAKKYNAQGTFSARTIKNCYVRQRGKCRMCQERMFDKFEVDHIKPLSKGGANTPENIQLLCPTCNRVKGTKTGV